MVIELGLGRGGVRLALILLLVAFMPGWATSQVPVEDLTGMACEDCTIRLVSVAVLGDPDGPGMLETEYNRVETDSRGRYYVSGAVYPPYVWVFDEAGRVLHRIGQRGRGPGEYQGISGAVIGPGDTLYVIDPLQRRLSVYSPDYDLVRTVNLGFATGDAVVFLDSLMIANAGVRTTERVGYPLHLLDPHGEILRSFGSETGVYRSDMRDVIERRVIGKAEPDAVWSAFINQYRIERWDTAGRLTRVLAREVDWFPTWWTSRADAETPPETWFRGLQQQGDTLWLIFFIPDPNWRSAVGELASGYRVTDTNSYHDSIIEAVDLRSGRVIASARFNPVVSGFAGPGLVYGQGTDTLGNPVVPLWKMRIVQTPAREEESNE